MKNSRWNLPQMQSWENKIEMSKEKQLITLLKVRLFDFSSINNRYFPPYQFPSLKSPENIRKLYFQLS